MRRKIWGAIAAATLVIAISAAAVIATEARYEGEEYCIEHQAWPNGSWLGQFHPWHQQHYINVFGLEAACPAWAGDQRNSAIGGLRQLGYSVREPYSAAGQGKVIDPGPVTSAEELLEQVRDAIVRVHTRQGTGSGFIFAVEETTAFVATNHHVIERADEVDVQAPNGNSYKALVLGWDDERDVAVLAICCSYEFAALTWAPAAAEVGELVVAIGFPRSTAGGLIATTGAITETDAQSRQHGFLPHSSPLNPGNSGGPLFSMPEAKVLGINTARGLVDLSFYAVPYQAVAESIGQWRAQLVIEPAPPLSPSTTYPIVRGEESSYKVNEVRDPVSGEAAVGKRLVAVDITQTGIVDNARYSGSDFSLRDRAGYVYEGSIGFGGSKAIIGREIIEVGIEPLLEYGNLGQGVSRRGWVVFELPSSAVPAAILVEHSWVQPAIVIATIG